MDETEVQVEIACWAQEHPEAERVNWKDGNEPWVSFEGKLCTLHVGLGGLIWNIQVPVGYQTELSVDGSRRRCWDPLDLHDTLIVPDRNMPFHVSVVYPNQQICNAADETMLLVQQPEPEPGFDYREAQESVTNLIKKLQLSDENSDTRAHQEERLHIKSRACFRAMNRAETLSEVLDAIHTLTTFHRWSYAASGADLEDSQTSSSMKCDGNSGVSVEDDLFGPELALKWSWIRCQVEYAADACRMASRKGRNTDPKSSSRMILVRMVGVTDGLEIAHSISQSSGSSLSTESPNFKFEDSESKHMAREFDYVREASSIDTRTYKSLKGSRSISRSDSDSQLSVHSDESWEEVVGMSDDEVPTEILLQSLAMNVGEQTGVQGQLPSQNKRKFQQIYTRPGEREAAARAADDHASTTTRSTHISPGLDAGGQEFLAYCDISFNAASFSVECSIKLEQFMDNNTAAITAMGLSLDHPLRLEIVPNKEQVDALAWTGAVEVYASQQSEWHSHMSEEVCGLLCFIPYIVRHFFEMNVAAFLGHRPTREPRGDLFIGLLQTVVKRLANVDRDHCCVCSGPLLQVFRTLSSRIMWPCEDNMCQALFASWQTVSTYDADERARQEKESLAEVESDLRDDFPFSTAILDNLRSALDVYRVDSEGLHYGQMIRALARIELWNRRDLEKFL
ncbi:hypothetical protein MPTK1_2g20260 [Marchantia polymorpha subsp. ruderalis]|nr:hypothetical protein MARPO_0055s0023 [Marchantia polymorpha]BBN03047.1 hypothetical protein Mp_2g20260 [Marchantia polymorpha subsp. ruderalis]PTQ37737.1 hypothetical protein MARPO_0055s0023 [Marchantia polymorpha]PTQ37738.1 hypothetical protein MARPO_0055s0023 [Marchantia polymorpha]BBN03048.1 hypothetical protein Mp_2g20260 [Marchantia polymorpha subsp. ruderalis]|eukprot:PTQ37736.1 hypothetical protein MARPO_0055s0023 [Marchantia polymorpha]